MTELEKYYNKFDEDHRLTTPAAPGRLSSELMAFTAKAFYYDAYSCNDEVNAPLQSVTLLFNFACRFCLP